MDAPARTPRQRILEGLINGFVWSSLFLPAFIWVQERPFSTGSWLPLVLAILFLVPMVVHLAVNPRAPPRAWLRGVLLALLPSTIVILTHLPFPRGNVPYAFVWAWGPVVFVIVAFVLRMVSLPPQERAEKQNAYGGRYLMLLLFVWVFAFYVALFAFPWE